MAGLNSLTHFQPLFPSTHNLIFCYCPASTGQVDVASINLGFLKMADTQCLFLIIQLPRHLEIIPLPSSLFLLFLREKNNIYYRSWSHPLRPCHMQISLSCHQWIEFNHSLIFFLTGCLYHAVSCCPKRPNPLLPSSPIHYWKWRGGGILNSPNIIV